MYLYYGIGDNIIENKIVPFSRLFKSNGKYILEEEKFSKHYERTNQKIRILNCLRKDVVFLTPILPENLNIEMKRRVGNSFEGSYFYKINMNKLEREKMCIHLLFDQEEEGEFFPVNDETLSHFDEYMDYSQDAKDYWDNIKMNSDTKNSFLFAGTYLFLYKGEINLEDCEKIIL